MAAEPNGGTGTCFGHGGTGVDDAILSPLLVHAEGGTVVYEGCYAMTWLVHGNGYCPNPFTPLDTFLTNWRFEGAGVLYRIESGDVTMEGVFGGSGVACYDLPPPVAGVGVLCP